MAHRWLRKASPAALMAASVAASMAVLLASGCGEGESEPAPTEPPIEAPAPVEMGPCGHLGEPTVLLLRAIDFVAADGNIAEGLDLDGHVTGGGDDTGCGKRDFTAPDGTPGIDNQFARLLPAIQAVGGEGGFQSAIRRAVNEGSVLVTMQLDHLDDPQDDACVNLTLGRATGRPDIGNDGLIEAGQTFDRDPDAPSDRIESVAVVDGVLDAGPFTLALPMVVDDIELLITLRDMYVRGTFATDGAFTGLFGGSIVLDELNAFIDTIDEGSALFAAMRSVLSTNADLDPDEDGRCRRISIAVRFDAVPAFFFETE